MQLKKYFILLVTKKFTEISSCYRHSY